MLSTLKSLSIDGIALKQLSINGVIAWKKASSSPNKIPTAIDTDKSIFNGKGYIDNTRLSSSGATKSSDYVITTGYIVAKANDLVRIGGTTWKGVQTGVNYVCCYDSSFNFVCAVNSNGYYGGGTIGGDSSVATITLLDDSDIAYIRVSIYHKDVDVSNLIVTINEEITN